MWKCRFPYTFVYLMPNFCVEAFYFWKHSHLYKKCFTKQKWNLIFTIKQNLLSPKSKTQVLSTWFEQSFLECEADWIVYLNIMFKSIPGIDDPLIRVCKGIHLCNQILELRVIFPEVFWNSMKSEASTLRIT